jgi:phage tail tape-measure protein
MSRRHYKPQSTTKQTRQRSRTMCEANETLQKAAYELDQMWGKGLIDYAKLRQLLNTECKHGTGTE